MLPTLLTLPLLSLSLEPEIQLLRLVGHSNDVTGMLMLPSGVYGAATSGLAADGRGLARCRRLLTSSMDGTLRLWDVSADLMSLEVLYIQHVLSGKSYNIIVSSFFKLMFCT